MENFSAIKRNVYTCNDLIYINAMIYTTLIYTTCNDLIYTTCNDLNESPKNYAE